MYISKVKVSEEFNNVNGRHIWLGCHVKLNEGDDEKVAIKKAMDFLLESNGEASNRDTGSLPIIEVERFSVTQHEADLEFEEIKLRLSEFEFREDAQAYLDSTNFGFTIEARNLIINKPSKHKL